MCLYLRVRNVLLLLLTMMVMAMLHRRLLLFMCESAMIFRAEDK
jgi:hypothetical protein